jgi:hypothetical protein
MTVISQAELDKVLGESREQAAAVKPEIPAFKFRKASARRAGKFSADFRAITQDELDRTLRENP